ncbi:hypothetical protein JZO70_16085 [Enterococcus sp. 669A]|uniref:Uncharacterized protein n=1 Tax=Candidatus Enterococcus moelleringii TaxID=2815325 RepID=A0ABS3LDI9_9ENTE|nr:DUF6773 family protein [Enterococcus sp. 669A]MBO1307697.1 hypothetical protein [Enterococcus sp. 669A]
MKTKTIKDERVTQLKDKIQSEAYLVVTAGLFISMLVKQVAFDQPLSAFSTELIVMLIGAVYASARGSMLGYSSTSTSRFGKKSMVIVAIVVSVFVAVLSGVHNYSAYGDKYTSIFDFHFIVAIGFTFVSSFIFTSIILGAVYLVEEHGQKRLEKKLEDEEE